MATNNKFWKVFKKILLSLGIVVGAILVIAIVYLSYVMIAYHRIGSMNLDVYNRTSLLETPFEKDTEYKIVSYNIGFGAYEDDYGFFMDGGTQSWAWSEERLRINLQNIKNALASQDADVMILQEVDFDSTRTYKVDERSYYVNEFTNYNYTYAQNYDSPFLMYPFNQPHGANKSCLLTFSKGSFISANRVELEIESGFTKFLDLDRCYSKNVMLTKNGERFVIYNFHLSAYTSDGTIANKQLKQLLEDMEQEYQNGGYCIAGGDFNKDLLGDSSQYFGIKMDQNWAKPIPDEVWEGSSSTLVAPDPDCPSCRNADGPYNPSQFILTVDGFIKTPNIEKVECKVIDLQFKYSDHNPVEFTFKLK